MWWPPACGASGAQGDLPFIGLIGSRTKWAAFRRRLQERGFTAEELAQVTCPIGVPGIAGKQPGSDRRGRGGATAADAGRGRTG